MSALKVHLCVTSVNQKGMIAAQLSEVFEVLARESTLLKVWRKISS